MRKEVENWWLQAKEDFDSAEYNFQGGKFYVAAFMCQQAVEKALKAVCIKKFSELVKVHDLVFLAKKIKLPDGLIVDCDKLARIYTETRYPVGDIIPAKRFSVDSVKEFLQIANKVMKWLEKLL